MLCESCKERDAVVQHIQVMPTGVQNVHLCEKCAAAKGVETTITMQQHPLGDLVQAVQQAAAATADAASCTFCGSTQRDFRMTGRLGCAHCYEALEHSLRALLRQLHGNSKHVGIRYVAPQVQMESSVDSIHDLEDRLRRAVASEQFELAAELRDRIRVIE
jgi:protein arginine kinase activator